MPTASCGRKNLWVLAPLGVGSASASHPSAHPQKRWTWKTGKKKTTRYLKTVMSYDVIQRYSICDIRIVVNVFARNRSKKRPTKTGLPLDRVAWFIDDGLLRLKPWFFAKKNIAKTMTTRKLLMTNYLDIKCSIMFLIFVQILIP